MPFLLQYGPVPQFPLNPLSWAVVSTLYGL